MNPIHRDLTDEALGIKLQESEEGIHEFAAAHAPGPGTGPFRQKIRRGDILAMYPTARGWKHPRAMGTTPSGPRPLEKVREVSPNATAVPGARMHTGLAKVNQKFGIQPNR
jgi:hypothetical protein